MWPYLLVLAGLLVAMKVFGRAPIVILGTGEVAIVERFGMFHQRIEAGLHMLLPFVDRLKFIHWHCEAEGSDGKRCTMELQGYEIPMRERILDPMPVYGITRDNIKLSVNAVLWFKIEDPYKAAYAIDNLYESIRQILWTSLRDAVSRTTYLAVIGDKAELERELIRAFDKVLDSWGIMVSRVEIQDVRAPENIIRASEHAIANQREAEAKIALAESDRRARLLASETELEVVRQRVEGEIAQRKAQADAERDIQLRNAEAERDILLKDAEAKAGAERDIKLRDAEAGRGILVKDAEAQTQAKRLRAEVRRDALVFMREAAVSEQFQLALAQTKSFRKVVGAKNGGRTLVVPYGTADVLGAAQTLLQLAAPTARAE
jgi:regulator of protease activity HflC (stomatin/prohibitin superfamily)